MGEIRPFEIEIFFHDYVHQMSRNSSSHKVSVWTGSSNVVSLAVLGSLTFFNVSCNAEYIQIAQHY